ncbi:MAG TPA: sodium:solute symporter family protein [Nocardioidaceae bacterium]|nr:sodium:solute symporter family protein [Nocardioidaceae bacterium]
METGSNLIYLGALSVSIVLMLGLGIWVARRTSSGEDFLLAGRRLGTPLLLGTTLATLVGTGSSLGAVGFAYESGWAGTLYGIGGAAGVFGIVWLFADVRRYKFMTLSEEMSFYYGANYAVKGVVAVLLFIAEIGWLGAHVLGGSLYLSYLTDIDATVAKIFVAVGFGLYTIVGGYLADVITDAVQGTILFVGFSVLAVLALIEAGGFSGISQQVPAEATSFLGIESLGLVPAISLALVIAVGVLATPSYRQRIYSAASVKVVRRSFLAVGVLFAVFSVMPAIAGLSAQALNPGMGNTDLAFPYLATEIFPLWLGAFLLVAGMSATMSSGDSDAVTAVTILLRDVSQAVTGRLPRAENMVRYSRIGLAVVMTTALLFALVATSIIDYITLMISTLLTGILIAALLGKFWPRATWQGCLASLAGGSGAALLVNFNDEWTAFWGNPVIPSLLTALAAGVLVSLATPRNTVSSQEALRRLDEDRATLDVGTELRAGTMPEQEPEGAAPTSQKPAL